jgi:hypothetical protein
LGGERKEGKDYAWFSARCLTDAKQEISKMAIGG